MILEDNQSLSPSKSNHLHITTLGNFNVTANNRNLTQEFNNCIKLRELFMYLITFRDELVLSEKIIDAIWPDSDYADPKRTLRALIFRLRKVLHGHEATEGNCIIVYSCGCYKLEINKNCLLDVMKFETDFNQAYDFLSRDNDKAVDLFKGVIRMYGGEYLSATFGHDWLIPARNHYRRMFLQSVYESADILMDQKRYKEILEICETALKHELFEEEIHFRYIEALAAADDVKRARNHYTYVIKTFEREMGVKPSLALRGLHRLIFEETKIVGNDMTSISKGLSEIHTSLGPMICDVDFFRAQHHLEARRSERYGRKAFLGLLTMSRADYAAPDPKQLKKGMQVLKEILMSNLRNGDLVTQWNEAQFLLSLPGKNAEQANIALNKIIRKFLQVRKDEEIVVRLKVEAAFPVESQVRKFRMNDSKSSVFPS